MKLIHVVIFTTVIFLLQTTELIALERNLKLRPDMPALQNPGIPQLDEDTPDADVTGSSGLSIKPERLYRWVFEPGKRILFTVKGTNKDIILTIWDWENRPIAQTLFKDKSDARVRFDVKGRGTYILTLDQMANGKCMNRLIRSFSVCPSNEKKREQWKQSEFWVGQCSFPGWQGVKIDGGRLTAPAGFSEDDSRQMDAELVARMGVTISRINLAVARRDANGFDLDFSLTDKCVNAFASKGLLLDLQLFLPYGTGKGPIKETYIDVPEASATLYPLREIPYRYYVREIAKRYAKYAAFFQVGNEPGNQHQYKGSANDFADTVEQSVDEINKICPDVPATNGGYCVVNDTMKSIVTQIKGKTDFISYHCHDTFVGLKSWYSLMEQIHSEAGYSEVRFANTEMGFYMPKVAGERTNAVYEMQKLIYCWAHGNTGVLLYSSREIFWPRQYLAKNGADYGFVDYYFCPRSVYGAVSAFLDHYAGYKFVRILKESDNVHAYEFSNGKKRLAAFFAVNGATEVRFRSDARTAQLIDPMGNTTAVPNAKDITLHAGEFPQTLAFTGAQNIELL